jgi:hypothetical protein
MMEPEAPPWMGCNRGKEVEAASRSFFGNLTSKKRPKEDSVISVAVRQTFLCWSWLFSNSGRGVKLSANILAGSRVLSAVGPALCMMA